MERSIATARRLKTVGRSLTFLAVTILSVVIIAVTPSFASALIAGDKNNDGLLDDTELLELINLWKAGQVGDTALLEAIEVWTNPPVFRAENMFAQSAFVPDNGIVKIAPNFIYWAFSWNSKPNIGDLMRAIDFEIRAPSDTLFWDGGEIYSDLPDMTFDMELPDDDNPAFNDLSVKTGCDCPEHHCYPGAGPYKLVPNHIYYIHIPIVSPVHEKRVVTVEVELKNMCHLPMEALQFTLFIGGYYDTSYGVWGNLQLLDEWAYLDTFKQTMRQVRHIRH